MMIGSLVEADEQSEKAIEPCYIPIFRRQVRLNLERLSKGLQTLQYVFIKGKD
jgi:hypothetical protein